MAGKLDLYRQFAADYTAGSDPTLVLTHPAKYLAIEGSGPPVYPDIADRLSALYSLALAIRDAARDRGRDYAISKLESQCWGSRKGLGFLAEPPSHWRWRLLIRTPTFITTADVKRAQVELAGKRKEPAVHRARLTRLAEGRCLQVLHTGAYGLEARAIRLLHDFAQANDLRLVGVHHDIFLNDPRKVPPDRLRTILRQPVG
jgi:hypothetical protein